MNAYEILVPISVGLIRYIREACSKCFAPRPATRRVLTLPCSLVQKSTTWVSKARLSIVAGRSAVLLLSEDWVKTFADVGMSFEVFPFAGECTAAEIRRGRQAAVASKARVIIGAGGGKVLDTARAIASDLGLPVVNCPTIASSDAPCSALSVIYTKQGRLKNTEFIAATPISSWWIRR